MRIRRAVPADAPELVRVYVESSNAGFPDSWPRIEADAARVIRWTEELTNGPARWWVAEAHGAIVGFVGVGPSRDPVDPNLGELDSIGVDPAHWRGGIGRALMAVAFEELATYREGILWTIAGYERAIAFYESLGWVADGGSRDEGRQVSFRWLPQRVADQGQ